jgi:hypothetical protein
VTRLLVTDSARTWTGFADVSRFKQSIPLYELWAIETAG